MTIQEIKLTKFPVIIITDSHCHVKRVNELKSQFPHQEFLCLGDVTDLFNKKDAFNKHSLQFFMDTKIPCLQGNHEEHILACLNAENGDTLTQWKVLPRFDEYAAIFDEYRVDKKHHEYLKTLPDGFKLILPNGKHYLCFHNRSRDKWSFTEEHTFTSVDEFVKAYPMIDGNTLGVLHGHGHKSFVKEYGLFPTKHYSIGALKFKEYATLDENGVHHKHL